MYNRLRVRQDISAHLILGRLHHHRISCSRESLYPMEKKQSQVQYLEKEDMLTLLQIYWSELSQRRAIQQNFTTIYITLLSAIVGASVAGASLLPAFPKNLFIAIGPILSFLIAHFARDTVKRQDSHVREVIALISKAENHLGLFGKVEVKGIAHRTDLWPADEAFVIPRWVSSRIQSGGSSEDFIKKKPGGTVRNLSRVFLVIQIVSVILLVGIIIMPFIP